MDPDQELYVVLQRTADWLMADVQSLLKGHGLSHQQYNVLRILRGVKGPLNCTEIANRMINRDPDMTRLLDRMETRGWIERALRKHGFKTVTGALTSILDWQSLATAAGGAGVDHRIRNGSAGGVGRTRHGVSQAAVFGVGRGAESTDHGDVETSSWVSASISVIRFVDVSCN